ncbi:DUF2207 family protein [Methanobrevibacter sp.]|uniref:DUF2207 family protein n=1 Tax=Methanobrevibacter sp. TaxID=66852 RepID=UPI00386A25C7
MNKTKGEIRMLGLNKKNAENKNIKNPPSDDSYPIVATLFRNKRLNNREIDIPCLSLTILNLINENQIKCEINYGNSYNINGKPNEDDLEVMKNITLRIANKGELKTSESIAINLLKRMNNSKKFNLKDMYKQSKNTAVANNFYKDFYSFKEAVENENNYDSKDYKDILANGKFSDKGKDIKRQWKSFQDYLKSEELTGKYPPESADENATQIIYAACFNIEKDASGLRDNNSTVCNFIDKDGYKLLNLIFDNALSNVSKKSKGTGIFYGVNDKYTIPGGG